MFAYNAEPVLRDINLTLAAGSFTCVLGPSGCGKSTLLRLIAGLIFPTAGAVLVDERTVTRPGLDRAVVFQDYSLFPWMTCHKNVMLALEQSGGTANRKERVALADSYLELVGLGGMNTAKGKLPGELSGGMRQRVAIARALAQNAPILLMDEPFGALDEITRAKQQDALLDLWQGSRDKTVFFVTHDVEEALILADRIVLFAAHPGRIARDFTVTLPRPRTHGQALRHSAFAELRNEILNELDRVAESVIESELNEGGGI